MMASVQHIINTRTTIRSFVFCNNNVCSKNRTALTSQDKISEDKRFTIRGTSKRIHNNNFIYITLFYQLYSKLRKLETKKNREPIIFLMIDQLIVCKSQ